MVREASNCVRSCGVRQALAEVLEAAIIFDYYELGFVT